MRQRAFQGPGGAIDVCRAPNLSVEQSQVDKLLRDGTKEELRDGVRASSGPSSARADHGVMIADSVTRHALFNLRAMECVLTSGRGSDVAQCLINDIPYAGIGKAL